MENSWTGDLIGQMHNARISRSDIAKKMGVHKSYVSMILNGQRHPKNAKERLTTAFIELKNKE